MRHASLNRTVSSTLALLACSLTVAWCGDNNGNGNGNNGADVYVQHNLVSDLVGMADHMDPNLVNAWGIDRSPTGPWWVNANGTGLSIVYDGTGALFPSVNPVMIPAPDGSAGTPTGIAFNSSMDFQLGPAMPALFLFGTEDGTILGWNPMVDAHHAVMKVNNSPAAVYKGITLGQVNGRSVLYAANFRGGTVDVFDTFFNPVTLPFGAFRDPQIPFGFAPFNVQNVNGSIFVTYAMQDDQKHDDVAGPGRGYVDQYSSDGVLMNRLEHGDWMNSPWGVVMTSGNFGKLSQKLLVGNFGSGQIAAFNLESGKFQSMMNGPNGEAITIDGLWGLKFGNGATAGSSDLLFFAAGIQAESHGLFGTLSPSKGGNQKGNNQGDNHGNDR